MTTRPGVPLKRVVLDACDGPFGSSLKSDHYRDDGARVIRLGNVGVGSWVDSDAAYIDLDYWRLLNRHHALTGDLIVAGLGDENHPVGRACVLPDLGPAMVKADCYRLRLDPMLADARFVALFLSSTAGSAEASKLADGATRSRLTLSKALSIPIPDVDLQRQRATVGYLDAETARIDKLIALRTEQARLMQTRLDVLVRQSISVDSDGNPYPRIPLRRRWEVVDCKHRTPEYVDDGIPVVSPGDAMPGRLDLDVCTRFVAREDFEDLAEGDRRPRRGDIVYSRNASIGIASYVGGDDEFTMGQDVCLIRSWTQDQRFLTYVLNTVGVDQLEEQKLGSTFSRINVSQILGLSIPCPPAGRQSAIADALDSASERTSRAVDAIAIAAGLLKERRQALITAAVTGQIEIPGVAA
jgi:type I restriction enzyme, S subunit